MDAAWEKAYLAMERGHFWAVARREFLLTKLERYNAFGKEASFADFGCSSGVLLEELKARGESNLIGIDVSEAAVSLAQKRDINAVVGDAENPDLPASSVDFILASDILEHLPNRDLALKNWHQILRPQGMLLVCVPGGSYLWSKHDEMNKHYLRYSLKGLRQQLADCGFGVVESGYWNSFLFPVAYTMAAIERLGLRRAVENTHQLHWSGGLTNSLLLQLLRLENQINKAGVFIPFGISCYAIAVRQES